MKSTSVLIQLTLLTITLASCSPKITIVQSPTEQAATNPTTFLEGQVLILQDGIYQDLGLDTKPTPAQGEDQFYRDMYASLRYPASARERSIQGTVMFEVDIDESGQVEKIARTTSVSPECDREAQSAIERGCSKGFEPYVYNGQSVKVRYLIPVNFRLM